MKYRLLILASVTVVVVVVLFGAPAAGANPPGEEFNQTYGGSSDDYTNDLIATDDGNYLLLGSGSKASVATVRKVKPDGSVIWTSEFGNGTQEFLGGVRTSDGGYAISGYARSNESDDYDGWIVKIDSNGNKQWESTFGGNNTDVFWDVAEAPNGDLILVGRTTASNYSEDAWVVKTNSNGTKSWGFVYWQFNRTGDEAFYGVEKTPSDHYRIAGEEYNRDFGDWDALAFEIDSAGDIVWSDFYGSTGDDFFLDVAKDGSGNWYFAGVKNGQYNHNTDQYDSGKAWVISIDSNENTVWSTSVSNGEYNRFDSVETHSDEVLAAGFVRPTPNTNEDALLARLDTQGQETWNTTFGGKGWDDFDAAVNASQGGYIVVGDTESYGSGGFDGWLLKASEINGTAGDGSSPGGLGLSASGSTASPGENATVSFNVTNQNGTDLRGVSIRIESLPSNWSIVSRSDDGGTWSAETKTWLWLSVSAGQSKTPKLTVQIPNGTELTDYTIVANASDGAGHVTLANATVTVSQAQSINNAIAGEDNVISIGELRDAINYWANGEAVPGTNGKTISLRKVRDLIQLWASGSEV